MKTETEPQRKPTQAEIVACIQKENNNNITRLNETVCQFMGGSDSKNKIERFLVNKNYQRQYYLFQSSKATNSLFVLLVEIDESLLSNIPSNPQSLFFLSQDDYQLLNTLERQCTHLSSYNKQLQKLNSLSQKNKLIQELKIDLAKSLNCLIETLPTNDNELLKSSTNRVNTLKQEIEKNKSTLEKKYPNQIIPSESYMQFLGSDFNNKTPVRKWLFTLDLTQLTQEERENIENFKQNNQPIKDAAISKLLEREFLVRDNDYIIGKEVNVLGNKSNRFFEVLFRDIRCDIHPFQITPMIMPLMSGYLKVDQTGNITLVKRDDPSQPLTYHLKDGWVDCERPIYTFFTYDNGKLQLDRKNESETSGYLFSVLLKQTFFGGIMHRIKNYMGYDGNKSNQPSSGGH